MSILSDGDRKLAQVQRSSDKRVSNTQVVHVQTEKAQANSNTLVSRPERQVKPRVLIVISGQPASTVQAEIAAGRQPRRDYLAIQQALDADILYLNDAQTTPPGRFLMRFFGQRVALSWTAFCRRHSYDILYTTNEITGLPLALLLKLSGTRPGRPRHVMLSHHPTPFKKRIFFHLGAGSHIDTLIVHTAAHHAFATKVLHLPDERVVKLSYFVDSNFWRPLAPPIVDSETATNAENSPIICAVGLEFRDYATLIAAVADLNVEVRIAAGTAIENKVPASVHHQTAKTPAHLPNLPSNVSRRFYDYPALLRLYTTSRFVIVPLFESEASAGVTSILEAMAMGKAVIVSGTRGQTDVVRDPRNNGRGPVVREWWPGFLDTPEIAETLGTLPTGFYVTPGDPNELHATIQYLLDHPEVAEELGRNGRRVAEAYFSLEAFTKRFAATIRDEPLPVDYP